MACDSLSKLLACFLKKVECLPVCTPLRFIGNLKSNPDKKIAFKVMGLALLALRHRDLLAGRYCQFPHEKSFSTSFDNDMRRISPAVPPKHPNSFPRPTPPLPTLPQPSGAFHPGSSVARVFVSHLLGPVGSDWDWLRPVIIFVRLEILRFLRVDEPPLRR